MSSPCIIRILATALALGAALLAGCSTFSRPEVDFPPARTAAPAPAPIAAPANGAIYQADAGTYRPLFEDRRARYVGDTLTIQINEKTQAASNQSTNADRSTSLKAAMPAISGVLGTSINPLSIAPTSEVKVDGKGQAAADNLFTGTITVTVVEVLGNGNLVVAGEKQIGIGQNMESLRLSGVVNPATIMAGNTVSSTQIADARIQTRGKGAIDQAQTTGWLSRFFLSFWPF